MLHEGVPIAGSSAGAICCATIAAGISCEEALKSCKRLCDDCRLNGTSGRLKQPLITLLEELLPEDVHLTINNRKEKIHLAFTSISPYPRAEIVSEFTSKIDLIEVVCASCCVPYYFTNGPTSLCRGRKTMDGYMSFPHRLGCPKTPAEQTVCVLPFPKSKIFFIPYKSSSKSGGCISPHQTKNFHSLTKLFEMASSPPTSEEIDDLYSQGFVSCSKWLYEEMNKPETPSSPMSFKKLIRYLQPRTKTPLGRLPSACKEGGEEEWNEVSEKEKMNCQSNIRSGPLGRCIPHMGDTSEYVPTVTSLYVTDKNDSPKNITNDTLDDDFPLSDILDSDEIIDRYVDECQKWIKGGKHGHVPYYCVDGNRQSKKIGKQADDNCSDSKKTDDNCSDSKTTKLSRRNTSK
eukprot:GHVL01022613.1.p1 GENE.GHVL01022613.1~~GHVL01022613.1.p1  ORF type:complete len:404 (+),score=77.63 GHVL01022613.1:341-1552(+)